MKYSSLDVIRQEHSALAAMLCSMRMMCRQGPRQDRARFFEVLRAMLFYVDEFPERLHHPKESELLFPAVRNSSAQGAKIVNQLDEQHQNSLNQVRALQHLLLAWELLGDARSEAFLAACDQFIDFYLHHMQAEEEQVFPLARQHLTDADWAALNAAFASSQDPLTANGLADPIYEALFTRIVTQAPEPIGLATR